MTEGVSLRLKGDVKAIIKDLDKIQRQLVPQVTASALNKAVKSDRTVVTRHVSRVKGIKPQKLIRNRLKIRKASRRKPRAELTALTANILVEDMKWRQTKKAGIKAGRHRFPHAFEAPIGGKPRPMVRKGRQRLPIKKLSIPIGDLTNTTIRRAQRTNGRPVFVKEFERQLAFRLQRRGLL